jgi:hypothetical protein
METRMIRKKLSGFATRLVNEFLSTVFQMRCTIVNRTPARYRLMYVLNSHTKTMTPATIK